MKLLSLSRGLPFPVSLPLVAALLLGSLACGKGNSFKGGGNKSEAEAVPAPPPPPPARELQGYTAPEIVGQDIKVIGDGTSALADPVDPDETSEVTRIQDGQVTKIGAPTTVVSDRHSQATCPDSAQLSDGSCLIPQAVYLWTPEGATDQANAILSIRSDSCKPSLSDSLCSHLQTHAYSAGYRSFNNVAFRSIELPESPSAVLQSILTSVSICHESVPSNGSEKEVVLGDLSNGACTSELDTFYGLTQQVKGTVPIHRWIKGQSIVLSVDGETAPGEGFIKADKPAFYALPPSSL